MSRKILRIRLSLFSTVWVFIFLTTISGTTNAQNCRVKRISPAGGFALSPVRAISQDRYDFIWFITRERLYQYNTRDFISFRPKFPAWISHTNNFINTFLIDDRNRIWIGTNSGLNRLDYSRHRLIYAQLYADGKPLKKLSIEEIKQNTMGAIWVLEGSSLARLDTAKMQLEYLQENNNRLVVHAFNFDREGNIFAVNNRGNLYHIDSETLEINKIQGDLPFSRINGIYFIDNIIFITTDGYGMFRLTPGGKILDTFFNSEIQSAGKLSNRIREVIKTSDGKIWVSTFNGLIQWTPEKIVQYVSNPEDNASLPDNSVLSLFEDKQKGLWIGTWRGGLAYINQYANNFVVNRHSNYLNSVCGDLINAVAQDKNDKMWIGSDGNGLDSYDEVTGQFTHMLLKGTDNRTFLSIKCILPFENGDIWTGIFRGGVFLKKSGENVFRQQFLQQQSVYDLAADKNGLWIATFGNGLYYFDFSDRSLKHFETEDRDPGSLPSNYLQKILIDRKGNLWIISVSGVIIKSPGKDSFDLLPLTLKDSSNSVQVYTIVDDHKGKIWLGTDQGLFSVNDSIHSVEQYPVEHDGKPVYVYGIGFQDFNKLWISTNFGIFSYNPAKRNYLNYSTDDGLHGNLFNAGAVCPARSGRLYFGSTTGLVSFNPFEMQINPHIPKVYFSKILVNHKEMLPGQPDSPLTGPLFEAQKLRLKPSQNSFSIEFVGLNYLNSERNQFRYRLNGFDEGWVESGYNNIATYTNLPPGNYTFEVLTCNNDLVWNMVPARLEIKIPPQFYRSPVAMFSYILFLFALLLFSRKVITNKARLEHQIEVERLKRIQEENYNQERMSFFTNISHEFRTPLTLISSPVDLLLKSTKLDQEQFNLVSLVKRNSIRLLNLINRLLEFRRIENSRPELDVCEMDIVQFLKEVFENFQENARQKSINLSFVSQTDTMFTTFDPDKIYMAVSNLLSNALKFTPENGNVQLEVATGMYEENEQTQSDIYRTGEVISMKFIRISVEDNGKGIEKQYLPKIFDRFFRADNQEFLDMGTGIGLHLTRHLITMHGGEIEVISSPGKGSIFHIRIPYGNAYLKQLEENNILIRYIPAPGEHESSFKHNFIENAVMKENWEIPTTVDEKSDKLILVVEDDRDLCNYIHHILAENFHVIFGYNGKTGLEKARTFLPDLIISDIMLPEQNGLEMVRILKSDTATSHIPVILLTAVVSNTLKIEGFNEGIDDYIEKPFSNEVLKARIRNILEKMHSLQKFYLGKLGQGLSNVVPDSPEQKLLTKAILYVENNISDEKLGIDTLSDFLSISRSTLHRKLTSLTGKPPTEFIRSIRLEYAARLMKGGKENIEKVSELAGFNSHSYFSRSFKEYFGQTPSEFLISHPDGPKTNI